MKKLFITLSFTIISCSVFSQETKVINPSPVYDTLRGTNNLMHGRFDVTHLTVLDTIDARTFRFINDYLRPTHVDLSRATIVSYKGPDGTAFFKSKYGKSIPLLSKDNELPASSFDNKYLRKIIFPASLSSIGNEAFRGSRIDSIVIPAGVKHIGKQAFTESYVKYVSLPDSLQYIDSLAFGNCRFSVIKIPENAKIKVAYRAFSECSLLREVVNSYNIDSIGEEAFLYCDSLSSFVLSDEISTINAGIFKKRSIFTTLNIPESVTDIKINRLEKQFFVVAKDNPVFSSIDGALYNKRQTTLLYFPKNISGTFTVPASVREIANSAFANSAIDTVICNENLIEIGDSAFFKCNNITSINLPDNLEEIGASAFYNCSKIRKITIPHKVTTIRDQTFTDCKRLDKLIIPESVKTIEPNALPRHQKRQQTLSVYWQNPRSVSYYMNVCMCFSDGDFLSESTSRILDNQILEVPFGTKEKYLATPPWSYYPVIIEREKE